MTFRMFRCENWLLDECGDALLGHRNSCKSPYAKRASAGTCLRAFFRSLAPPSPFPSPSLSSPWTKRENFLPLKRARSSTLFTNFLQSVHKLRISPPDFLRKTTRERGIERFLIRRFSFRGVRRTTTTTAETNQSLIARARVNLPILCTLRE